MLSPAAPVPSSGSYDHNKYSLVLWCVKIVAMDVVDDGVWEQIADAQAPTDQEPDLCRADIVEHVLPDQVHIILRWLIQ